MTDEQEVTPEKASKPIPDPELGRLALRVDFLVSDTGDVSIKIGNANPMANAYFLRHHPLAAAMIMGLTHKPTQAGMPAELPATQPDDDPGIPTPDG